MLVALPHAGRFYPPEVLERSKVSAGQLARLEDRYVDLIGKEAAARTGSCLVLNTVARASIDVNRAPNDMNPLVVRGEVGGFHPSAKALGGLGLIPDRLARIGPLWKRQLTDLEVSDALALWHAPYHQELAIRLKAIRRLFGAAILLDLHSMPPLPRPIGRSHPHRYVIGDDFGRTAAPEIIESIARTIRLANGVSSIGINAPYSGGYTIKQHAEPSNSIYAVQLEICRSRYLDADLLLPEDAKLKEQTWLIADMIERLSEIVLGGSQPIAAE